MNKYLPIGSVVLLKGAEKRIMIYGRRQKKSGTEEEFDYTACLFPEGNIDPSKSLLFDHKDIDKIFFIGCQDLEEIEFNKYLLESSSSRR